MQKIDRSYIRYIRYAVQWSIFFFLIYAGYKFYLFIEHFTSPDTQNPMPETFLSRPPSVEGFLPIGALMALKLWITTGIFDRIHPAGLVIFTVAVVMSFLLKKSFCGWICPVGALSDALWKLGRKIFNRNFILPKYGDYSLRSLKYLLMMFFIYVIVVKMPPSEIFTFLEGDYYKIADVKMLYFFTKMTLVTFITLLLLFIASLFFKNSWCRYLCPYGALLGILSLCSPIKITRNKDACIDCGKCAKNCPSLLPVDKKIRIKSPECTGCLTCVSHCPAKGALDMSLTKSRVLNPLVFAILIVGLFFGAIGVGKLTDKWNSTITYEEYKRIIPHASMLEHP
ncbi:MAG: 4Fe-4S binding protein [Thermodesulfovibrionales bacterium]|nr:4Fe-4S binding protein [Thermodesulfovibrionales bacterium]